MVELSVSEHHMRGNFNGHFRRFLAIDRLCTCLSRLLECLDISNAVFIQRCRIEFGGLRAAFFFLDTNRIRMMNEVGIEHEEAVGSPRLVNMTLPVDLEAMRSHGFSSIAKNLQWIHHFQVEVVDSKLENHHHNSGRRACSLAWDKPSECVTVQLVKRGACVLWHNAEDMVGSVRQYFEGVSSGDMCSLPDGGTIFLRVSMSVSLFWNLSSPRTILYLSATRKDYTEGGGNSSDREGTSLELKLIKITGFSGWVTSLFVDDICEAAEAQLLFVNKGERGGYCDSDCNMKENAPLQPFSPLFNTFSWHLRSTAPSNSLLLWVVHVLWHRLVMSAFLYEAFQFWGSLFTALAEHLCPIH